LKFSDYNILIVNNLRLKYFDENLTNQNFKTERPNNVLLYDS